MHRISEEGHVNNRFVTGNPQIGQKATRLGAKWPNTIQEEMCKVVEAAGIPLDANNDAQLYAAIVAIAAGAAGAGGGAVPTTRNVNGDGLVTGGGPLASDLTLTVLAASAAEVLAGVASNKAVTPASLASAFGRSLSSNGWGIQPFGGGLMEVWMNAIVAANGTTILNLPTSFPNLCFGAHCNGGHPVNNAQDNGPYVTGWGTSNVSIYNANDNSISVFIRAIGY